MKRNEKHRESFDLQMVALSNLTINEKEASELLQCDGKVIKFQNRWHRIVLEAEENLRALKRHGFRLTYEGGKPIRMRAAQIIASGLDQYLEKGTQKELRRIATRSQKHKVHVTARRPAR